MAITLAHARCFNHAHREAVARCPQCGRTFCRECIIEHDSRIICARCLAAPARKPAATWAPAAAIAGGTWRVLSFLLLWAVFYYLGKILLLLPSSFHEAAFWEKF